MVKKEIDEHVPLYAEFAELGIRADEIIESRTLTPVSAEECLEMSGKFEKLMADIDNGSQLYSGNRTKGEMKLRELRMLKAPAYIGMLMMIGDFPDEKEYLEKAIAYMTQYLALLRHLRIFKDNDADALMSSNGINYVDYLKNVAMLSYHKRLRRKLLKDNGTSELIAFEQIRRTNPQATPNLGEVRRLCYSELRYHAQWVIEKLFFAKATLKRIFKEEELSEHVKWLSENRLSIADNDSTDLPKVCSESEKACRLSKPSSSNDEKCQEKTTTDNEKTLKESGGGSGASKKKRHRRRGRK